MSSIISYRLEGKLIIRLTLCRSQSHQPAHPIACHNQPELEELRKQLKELLDAGLLQPAKSPYGAPLLFQKKQDGSLRMCVDYRALNKVTIRNNYPIPLVADCFDQLSKATVFTKLDLRSGYWQVRIAEGDESKTTCVTRYGGVRCHVVWLDQRGSNLLYANESGSPRLSGEFRCGLSRLVIYSSSLEEHSVHLRKVFARLREHELYVVEMLF